MAETHNPVYSSRIIFGFLRQYTKEDNVDPRLIGYHHSGVDLQSPFETYPVRPLADGIVRHILRAGIGRKDKFVIIEHKLPGIGVAFARYGHLAADGIIPRVGQRMLKQHSIGLIDPTYKHCHLDLMRNCWPYYFPVTKWQIEHYFYDPTPWVRAETSPDDPPPTVEQRTVNTAVLNVRGGPGVSYPVVRKIKRGEVVTVMEESADQLWLKIAAGEWSSAYFLVKVE